MARSTSAGREPWWATALTGGLLVLGFRRARPRREEEPAAAKVERGWREVLRILYGNVAEHRVTAIAAGVTYFALLAMFPFIAAVVAIYGLFGDAAGLGAQLDQLSFFLPGGAIDVIRDQLD